MTVGAESPLKDEVLSRLANSYNTAVFVSFSPGIPRVRYFRLRPGPDPSDLDDAIALVLSQSREKMLNVRTFRDAESKSTPFVYGLDNPDEIAHEVRRLAGEGFYTILNETIDVHDGGVSGVRLGDVVEFSPDTTPRGVEEIGASFARMPVKIAEEMLSVVYGFDVEIPGGDAQRVEFSVHPERVGNRQDHVCVWEAEAVEPVTIGAGVDWPNSFSRLVGDKTFGLLIAHLSGLSVPYTTAISRRIAPFAFGQRTATGEWWIRTAPREQTPGKYSTARGWSDPFVLLADEDPEGHALAAVLAQEGVAAAFSGATLLAESGEVVVEGVAGYGDAFMLGEAEPEALPTSVTSAVRSTVSRLWHVLGPVRIEWAYDGAVVWVLQLHRTVEASASVIAAGSPESWIEFDPASELEALRQMAQDIAGGAAGILFARPVGITSHFGDVLRKAGVPARFGRAGQ